MCLCVIVFLCVLMDSWGSSSRTVDRGFALQLVLPKHSPRHKKKSTGIDSLCEWVAAALASGGGPIVRE